MDVLMSVVTVYIHVSYVKPVSFLKTEKTRSPMNGERMKRLDDEIDIALKPSGKDDCLCEDAIIDHTKRLPQDL